MNIKKTPLVFLFALLLFSCKKDLPSPDENGYIWLRDIESLSLTKKTIQGKWKIHYRYGGFTGRQKTALSDSWFEYKPNDSMYIISEGRTYAATRPKFVRKQTKFGYNAWILDFEFKNAWELRDEWVIESMKNDTLCLVQNAPDSDGYYMTKF